MTRQLATLALLLAAVAQRGDAQMLRTIRGLVLDTANHPVADVSIIPRRGQAVTTDDSGRFRLSLEGHADAVFDLRRVGYMPSRFGLTAGGDTEIVVKMFPGGARLPVVRVKSHLSDLPAPLAGFESRMAAREHGAGSGTFITAKDIEDMKASRSTEIFATVPTLAVHHVGANEDRYGVFGRSTRGGECPVTVLLDGVRQDPGGDPVAVPTGRGRRTFTTSPATGVPIDDIVAPSDIAGIEIYTSGLMAPTQYQPHDWTELNCTLVMIWTKHRAP